MKAIVEWGRPKAACKIRPCGVSGEFPVENVVQARRLATQLMHTMTEGCSPPLKTAWAVSKDVPRAVVWSEDRTAWVAVSLLDGVPRGPYAALADKAHAEGTF